MAKRFLGGSKPTPEPETLFGFVNSTRQREDHPSFVDYSAIVVDRHGDFVARHVGPSKEDCKDTLQGYRHGSPWRMEYDQRFPQGWVFEWIDDPKKDPRLRRIEHRFQKERKLEKPTGDDDPDDEGNPDELFDSLNQKVMRGPVSWEPVEGKFAKVLVFRAFEDLGDARELRAARRVWSDPIIASATPSVSQPATPPPAPETPRETGTQGSTPDSTP